MRLTETSRSGGCITLTVEGWITSASSPLLESECGALLKRGHRVRLDCHLLRYVDEHGAAALRRLVARRVKLTSCSPVVLEVVERAGE
jgi:hypothetical protein